MPGCSLFLFDLDGTLVSTGGAGLRALDAAFAELYGIENVRTIVDPSGKTDVAIFREILRSALGRDLEAHETPIISGAYLRHLAHHMKTAPVRALRGVAEFLRHLEQRSDIVVALGTGNLEMGARLKLEPTGLNRHFAIGGFGSDAEIRAEVLIAGHRRAEERAGESIAKERVYVIGDTPLDVAAARVAGYKAVAVASGGFPLEALRGAAPDYLWEDMNAGFEFVRGLDRAAAS